MRFYIFLFFCLLFFLNCDDKPKIDAQYIIERFENTMDTINMVEYRARRIDSFPDGTVWDNTGYAIVEKDALDTIFGVSFYGKRDDMENEYIYDRGNGFTVNEENRNYKIDRISIGFKGKSGGQMIPDNIFNLDSVYKSVDFTEDKDSYNLNFTYVNDTVYNLSEIVKTIEISKHSLLPIRIRKSSNSLGDIKVSEILLTEIEVNNKVNGSIDSYIEKFKDYEIIEPTKRGINPLIGNQIPTARLPRLENRSIIDTIPNKSLTLIDFWETWCGPCLKSLPEVDRLNTTYSPRLKVVGILTENEEKAKLILKEKGISFQNLIGDYELQNKFYVNSWPRYFLVDSDGIIIEEYFGFSEQIENDIINLIDN